MPKLKPILQSNVQNTKIKDYFSNGTTSEAALFPSKTQDTLSPEDTCSPSISSSTHTPAKVGGPAYCDVLGNDKSNLSDLEKVALLQGHWNFVDLHKFSFPAR